MDKDFDKWNKMKKEVNSLQKVSQFTEREI